MLDELRDIHEAAYEKQHLIGRNKTLKLPMQTAGDVDTLSLFPS
jgi:hypothetical protein